MSDSEKRAKGGEILGKIYGEQMAGYIMSEPSSPYVDETVEHLFGHVWDRPGLSVRDRRLLVLGASAMLGRPDLIEVQVKGALLAGDFDKEQLDEAVYQLAYYVGWGNASALTRGVSAALQAVDADADADADAEK